MAPVERRSIHAGDESHVLGRLHAALDLERGDAGRDERGQQFDAGQVARGQQVVAGDVGDVARRLPRAGRADGTAGRTVPRFAERPPIMDDIRHWPE